MADTVKVDVGSREATDGATTTLDVEKLGYFYLGKTEDGAPYLYDSKHLTTHGVIVGMTGSGKTGLSVALLEEAAIDGLPAIVIDPKGDLSNLLLTFPSLTAEAIAPWVAEGKAPAEEAAAWKAGISEWGQTEARIARLRESAEFCVYTPGSSAGLPVSLLQSLESPGKDADAEVLRDRVVSIVSGLLGLVGIEADPVKSREHVLLSNILHTAFSQGKSLDLPTLIGKIADPRIAKIGVLDLETFYPKKERLELAAVFNNLLASPGFAAWLEGPALDVPSLLRTKNGKPRVAIFSIAHLGDQERMFFVTLLLSQIVAWMRTQSGTTSLRALLYMDEIFGYFPPVANPPSKGPLLTLLKQARAFGLGVVLATQNPMDLDYKGLSNTGSWFIGRLQTERDKARLVEGLTGAGGAVNPDALAQLLSSLEKRQFLVHNVHDASGPKLLRTRFTLSYLRGPLTREHLRVLQPKAQEAAAPKNVATSEAVSRDITGASELPMLPDGIPQVFVGKAPFVPHFLGVASVRFTDAKLSVDETREVRFRFPFAPEGQSAVPVLWDKAVWLDVAPADLPTVAPEGATGSPPPSLATKVKSFGALSKDFQGWLLENQGMVRRQSPSTGLVSNEGESEEAFRGRIAQAFRETRDSAVEKLRAKFAPKFEALRSKIEAETQAAAAARSDAQSAFAAQSVAVGASLFSAAFGRGSVGTAVSKGARAAASARKKSLSAEGREARVRDLQDKWRALDSDFQACVKELGTEASSEVLTEITLRPKKTAVRVALGALAWIGSGTELDRRMP